MVSILCKMPLQSIAIGARQREKLLQLIAMANRAAIFVQAFGLKLLCRLGKFAKSGEPVKPDSLAEVQVKALGNLTAVPLAKFV